MSVYEVECHNGGVIVGTLTDEDADISFRVGYRGDPGELRITLNRHSDKADHIGQGFRYFVTVPQIDADPIAAYVGTEAEYQLLHANEQGGQTLKLKGSGLKHLLTYSRLLWHPYAPGQTARGSADRAHNIWWWVNEPYGGIALRMLEEAINQPGSPLSGFTPTFTRTQDSDGNAWDTIAEEWQTTVGSSIADGIAAMEDLGDFYLEFLPDMTINAYQSYSGRDQTGTVHLSTSTPILTGLRRRVDGRRGLTHLLLEDSDGYYSEEAITGAPLAGGIWGYHKASTNDDTALNKIGQEVLRASRTALAPFECEIPVDVHLPGPEGTAGVLWPADTILVTTGSSEQDFSADPQLVTGLRFSLAEAARSDTAAHAKKSMRVVVECNVDGSASPQPTVGAGFGGPAVPHSHDDLFCRPGYVSDDVFAARYYFSTAGTGLADQAMSASWADAATEDVLLLKPAPDDSYVATSVTVFDGPGTAVSNRAWNKIYAFQITDADLLARIQAGGLALQAQMRARSKYGTGVTESVQNDIAQMVVRVWRSGSGFVGTMLAAHSAASGTKFPAQSTAINRTFSGTASAVAGAALNDWVFVEVGCRHLGPTSGGAGAFLILNSQIGDVDLPEDESTSTNSNSWFQLSQAGGAVVIEGDLPRDTVHQGEESVGTATRASRCDHEHAHGLLSEDGLHYHDESQINGGLLSDLVPLVESGSGSAGTADTAARGDHVHPADGGGGGGSGIDPQRQLVAASVNANSSTYATKTGGPSVTVTVGSSGKVLVQWGAIILINSATTSRFASIKIVMSGANTGDVSVRVCGIRNSPAQFAQHASQFALLTGLTPGSTTFEAQYQCSTDNADFTERELAVSPF